MAPSHVKAWVQELLSASFQSDKKAVQAAERILKQVNDHYTTDCSRQKHVGMIRRLYMEAEPGPKQRNTHKKYAAGIQGLEKALEALDPEGECAKAVRSFLDAPLHAQHSEWRMRQKPDFCNKNEEMRRMLQDLYILPDFMKKFHVSKQIKHNCDLESTENLEESLYNSKTIKDGNEVMTMLTKLLDNPEEKNISQLLIGLAGVSGRRQSEIASQDSVFTPYPGSSRGLWFEGQLKKQGTSSYPRYIIPLIGVNSKTFLSALSELRKKQKNIEGMTTKQISELHQSNARKQLLIEFRKLHQFQRKPPLPSNSLPTFHGLRSFYIAALYTCYDWGTVAEPLVIKRFLGHETLKTSLNYKKVQVQGLSCNYGVFPFSKNDRDYAKKPLSKDKVADPV